MNQRAASSLGVLAMVIAAAAVALSGQAQPTVGKPWKAPRTPDGQPDFQGIWVNLDATPFELSPNAPPPPGPPPGPSEIRGSQLNERGLDRKARPSMVVRPENGRVPVMSWAEEKRTYDSAHLMDSWLHHTPWERCITRGVPGGIFPANYNSGYQFVQGPGYFAFIYEMIHEARIIPIDGSPHLPRNIRLWNGDSRGRWEDETFVVDITNYNDKSSIATSGATINYEVTIEDPKVYTAPWTVAMPLNRDDNYQIFEYTCHEGNHSLEIALAGGRLDEKQGSKEPRGSSPAVANCRLTTETDDCRLPTADSRRPRARRERGCQWRTMR